MHQKTQEFSRWIATPPSGYAAWLIGTTWVPITNPWFYMSIVVMLMCFATTLVAPKLRFAVCLSTIYLVCVIELAIYMAFEDGAWIYSALWLRDVPVVFLLPILVAGVVGYLLQVVLRRGISHVTRHPAHPRR